MGKAGEQGPGCSKDLVVYEGSERLLVPEKHMLDLVK